MKDASRDEAARAGRRAGSGPHRHCDGGRAVTRRRRHVPRADRREEHRRVHARDGARVRTISARRTTRRTPSGFSRGSRSGAGTRRSRPSTCCSRRRRSACSSWSARRRSRPRSRSRRRRSIRPRRQKTEQLPPFNAYSIDGDVTGPLVYVNYGRPEDYEELERRGISVKGAIVIARYGAVVARHQAQGRRRARRDRLPDLFRSARRRVLRGRRVSGRPDAHRGRRAARQRDGHADVSRRSADAGRRRDGRRRSGSTSRPRRR